MRVTHTTDEMENLCDFCDRSYEYPACCPDYVEFGDGIGGDNIVTCGNFLELEKKTVPELVKLRKVAEAGEKAIKTLDNTCYLFAKADDRAIHNEAVKIFWQALAELDKAKEGQDG